MRRRDLGLVLFLLGSWMEPAAAQGVLTDAAYRSLAKEPALPARLIAPGFAGDVLSSKRFLKNTLRVWRTEDSLPASVDEYPPQLSVLSPEVETLARKGNLPVLMGLFFQLGRRHFTRARLEELRGRTPHGPRHVRALEVEQMPRGRGRRWDQLPSAVRNERKRASTKGDLLAGLWLITSNSSRKLARRGRNWDPFEVKPRNPGEAVLFVPVVGFQVLGDDIKSSANRRRFRNYVKRVRKILRRAPRSEPGGEILPEHRERLGIDFLLEVARSP